MSNIQESITSILQERNTKKHLALVVCMIAVCTALGVFWSLHLNGITLSSGDLACGMEEHTHTSDCYDWVALEEDTNTETETAGTESTETGTAVTEDTETCVTEDTGTSRTENTADTSASAASASTDDTAGEASEISAAEIGESESASVDSEDTETTETETDTEEDNESPQPGDTKVVDGVTYVYTLVCELEEHTHTDECYASEDDEDADAAEETDADEVDIADLTGGAAKITSYGVSAASLDDDDDGTATVSDENTGESTENDEENAVISVSATSDENTYYFADSTTLTYAAANQDEEYLVYTIIDGTYYVVSAEDGSLLACTDLSTYSTDDNKVTASTEPGIYIWSVTDGVPTFKCTTGTDSNTGITYDFADYRWTISGTADDDDTGSGSYMVKNEENSVYLAPKLDTTSETVYGNISNSTVGVGYSTDSLTLPSNGKAVYTLYSATRNNNNVQFAIEITDENESVLYANSKGTITLGGTALSCSILGSVATTTPQYYYTITVIRQDNDLYINFYNSTLDATLVYFVEDTTLSGSLSIRFRADYGTYNYVSGITAEIADGYGTETGIEGEYSSEDLTAVATTKKTLSGDFDITYSFTNKSSSSSNRDYNYVIEVYNGSNMYIDIQANNSGWTWDTTAGEEGTGGNGTAPTFASATISDAWQTAMYNGQTCSVRVIRTGNTFFFVTTAGDYGSFVSYITLDDFDGCEAQVYLMCYHSSLSNITYTDNTATAYNGTYKRVSSTSTAAALTAEDGSTGWIASAEGSYGETLYLVGQTTTTTDADENTTTTSMIEWVDNTASGGTITAGTTTSLDGTYAYVTTFCLAEVREYTVYFDGTNGNTGNYSRVTSEVLASTYADSTGNCYIDMQTATFNEDGDYRGYDSFTLRGWYDIYDINTEKNGTAYYNMIDTVVEAEDASYESVYAYGSNAKNYTGVPIPIVGDTVFYADWYVTDDDYNITPDDANGLLYDAEDEEHENTVTNGYGAGGVDTSSFMTTTVFDYNDLFNMYSSLLANYTVSTDDEGNKVYKYYSSLDASSHTEYWALTGNGSYASRLLSTGLNFIFLNQNGAGNGNTLSYVIRGTTWSTNTIVAQNGSRNYHTSGILNVNKDSNALLKYLFDPTNAMNTADSTSEAVLGKTYVGEGNYLFQYNEVNGYYYYDAAHNAATYSSDDNRFYLYDYTVRMTKSYSASDTSSSSDFLPFNYASSDSAWIYTYGIDYWFGMDTELTFTLPNKVGTVATASQSNQSTAGDMVFKFIGDDDLWVYVDDYLVLDLGGMHGEVYGEINFSNGTVTIVDYLQNTYYYIVDSNGDYATDNNGDIYISTSESGLTDTLNELNNTTSGYSIESSTGLEIFIEEDRYGLYQVTDYAYTARAVTTYTFNSSDVTEYGYTNITDTGLDSDAVTKITSSGPHTLSMYYLERGGSESNLAVLTNLTPTYDLTITKEDSSTYETLNGAVFEIYEASDVSGYAGSSYNSFKEYITNVATPVGTYDTSESGNAYQVTATGLYPLHTYYIVETKAPGTYPESDVVISVYLDYSTSILTITVIDENGNTVATYYYEYSTTDGNSSAWLTTDSDTDSSYIDTTSTSTYPVTISYDDDDAVYSIAISILNTYEYELPSTGSIGTYRFIEAGEILVLMSAVGLMAIAFYRFVWKRKLRAMKINEEYTKEETRPDKNYAGVRGHPRERSITHCHARDRPGDR